MTGIRCGGHKILRASHVVDEKYGWGYIWRASSMVSVKRGGRHIWRELIVVRRYLWVILGIEGVTIYGIYDIYAGYYNIAGESYMWWVLV